MVHENLPSSFWLLTTLATLTVISEKKGLQSVKQQITQILGRSPQIKIKNEKKGLQSAKQADFPRVSGDLQKIKRKRSRIFRVLD